MINRKYQRKLVWTLEEKERLIGSILKGYPIPLILLAERPQLDGSGKYEVIDGMQRLNAIFSFIENSFTFQEKFFDLDEFSFAKQKAEDKVFESVDSNLPRLSASECADIQDYQLAVTIYKAKEPPVLGQGAELIINLENSLRRSRIETNRYECKQGLLNLDHSRELNNDLLQRLIHTICGIANLGPEADGYIFLGVADKIKDAERIKTLDKITPFEINERYIVGIDREAKVKQSNLENYVKILADTIDNSELTEPLKSQVLTGFDTISYKGLSVLRITIPAQSQLSFVGDIAFMRKDSSTEEIKGQKLLAIANLFSNINS